MQGFLLKRAVLELKNIQLGPDQIHKLRGFIGNLFMEHDIIHNHSLKTGNVIYRYPLIQFKVVDDIPIIVAMTEKAIDVFSELFMKLDEIDIDGVKIPVHEESLKVENVEFGISEKSHKYEFTAPWIALNQEKYKKYHALDSLQEKSEKLNSILVENLLSMSEYLDYTVEEQFDAIVRVTPVKVNLKKKSLMGFRGMFDVNFAIPDDFGIGKSVSRGFGNVRRVEK